jgi:hypothetical protein
LNPLRAGAIGGLLALALAGCAPAPRAALTSLDSLGRDEAVIVGRVELVPPLRKGEQKIRGMVVGDFENRLYLMIDEKLRPLREDPALADYAGRIEASIGTTFFVRSRSAPFYILGGVLFLEIGGSSVQRVYFPGGFQVALKPGDRAVYIGTVRYHRDEFFEVTCVTVADDYREASAEFASRFGGREVLRKALMTGPKQQGAADALPDKTLVQ